MNKNLKIGIFSAVRVVIFLFLFFAMFWFLQQVLLLKRPNGIVPMQNLYAQKKNTVDVLFCGSSQMGMGVSIDELWCDFGIAGYNLWGDVQPFWNTYYCFKEALNYQSPKVVVLEVSGAARTFQYSDGMSQLSNTQGMRFGSNFLGAIVASSPLNRRLDLLFNITTFHSRYKELSKKDFMHFPWSKNLIDEKGNSVRYGNYMPMDMRDVSGVTEVKKMIPKAEVYFRKFVELCRERNIELLLFAAPHEDRMNAQPYYNYVSQLAAEYSIDFLNLNLLDNEVGFVPEDSWDGCHLNTRGARRMSRYLGKLLKEKYGISDRRGDTGYSSWNANAVMMRKEYLGMLEPEGAEYAEELEEVGRLKEIKAR